MKNFPNKQTIKYELSQLINRIMLRSELSSGAYDTAWLARLAVRYSGHGYDSGIEWLRAHQHADGSWGSDVFHYHDRVICTLAGFLALSELNDSQDGGCLNNARRFLELNVSNTDLDLMDTIGFPLIFTRLVHDVAKHGLIIDDGLIPIEKIEAKLATVPKLETIHEQSLFYSFESVAGYYPRVIPLPTDDDGCVGSSPSATISAILYNITADRSLEYVSNLVTHQGDGGLPTVDFADTFEITWVLDNLRYAGLIKPGDKNVKHILDYLWSIWESRGGHISFSSRFKMPDLDETAVAFTLLRWAGYPADDSVFEMFEGDDYFYCYPGELDPSLSANIRFLVALQFMDHPKKDCWQEKVMSAIREWTQDVYWFDKWHVSPYYLTASSVWMLQGIMDDVLPEKIEWIRSTQNLDGGWGYYGRSTVEETAYCIHALSRWYMVHGVGCDEIRRAKSYLASSDYSPAMWVGKCLYTPHKVIKSSILSAWNASMDI